MRLVMSRTTPTAPSSSRLLPRPCTCFHRTPRLTSLLPAWSSSLVARTLTASFSSHPSPFSRTPTSVTNDSTQSWSRTSLSHTRRRLGTLLFMARTPSLPLSAAPGPHCWAPPLATSTVTLDVEANPPPDSAALLKEDETTTPRGLASVPWSCLGPSPLPRSEFIIAWSWVARPALRIVCSSRGTLCCHNPLSSPCPVVAKKGCASAWRRLTRT